MAFKHGKALGLGFEKRCYPVWRRHGSYNSISSGWLASVNHIQTREQVLAEKHRTGYGPTCLRVGSKYVMYTCFCAFLPGKSSESIFFLQSLRRNF